MTINRRNTLIGLGALAVGGGVLSATGAFTQVEADRTVEVNVAGDADAILSLQVSGAGVDSGVVFEDAGLLTIDFSEAADGDQGVNLGARTTIGELDDSAEPEEILGDGEAFLIINNGSQAIHVDFDIDFHADQSGQNVAGGAPEDHLKLWTDVSGTSATIDAGDFGNLVADEIRDLAPGEEARVAIQVDTADLDEDDVDVGSPLFDSEATIRADAA